MPPVWRCSSPRATRTKRAKALKLGAERRAGDRCAVCRCKVDAVIESVGGSGHMGPFSCGRCVPAGTIAICGATTGDQPGAELTRLFFQDIRVQGLYTMGSREDFARLLRFVEHADLHPVIDSVVSGLDAAQGVRQNDRRRHVRQDRY